MIRKLALFTMGALASAQTSLKIGTMFQATGLGSYGKDAFDAWKAWVDTQTDLGYTVTMTQKDYNSSNIATDVADFTGASSANKVHVLVTPYGSGGSGSVIDAIDSAWDGTVLIWGGASDTLFSVNCVNKAFKCFGLFTKGSEYMTTGLQGLDAASTAPLSVLLVENSNSFSYSLCDGANATIAASPGLTLAGSFSFSDKSSLTADETTELQAAMANKPDIVAICGHNGFVEPAILAIAAHDYRPKAILSTNSITGTATAVLGDKASCLMMPTQWAESATATDSIVGWTTSSFKTALGDSATYHSASAAAAAIAITHAMAENADPALLATTLDGLSEISSFYGPLDWNADGSIKKPMYTQQMHGSTINIVLPTAAKTADLSMPLKGCPAWGLLKVGGALQATGTGSYGKDAYTAWADWVNAQDDLMYAVELSWKSYDASTLAADIEAFTSPSSADKVDVLVLPYTSGASIAAIGAVSTSFTGPVMVWGGASDTIFDSTCVGKPFKCFGFFTKGSQYMATGLAALDAASTDTLNVLLVENNNAFSKAVCEGANATIQAAAGLTLVDRIKFAEKTAPTDDELSLVVNTTATANVDVVAVCGHSGGFVEPVITEIGAGAAVPKAILATNALTSGAMATIGNKSSCVMMPTQWAESATANDSIVGWTSADFKTALGASATYHGASAGASAIILSHALAANSDVSALSATIAGLPSIETFYGPIDFDTSGAITKPMYTQQKQAAGIVVVAPADATTSEMNYPLSTCAEWSNSSGDTDTQASLSSASATLQVMTVIICALVVSM